MEHPRSQAGPGGDCPQRRTRLGSRFWRRESQSMLKTTEGVRANPAANVPFYATSAGVYLIVVSYFVVQAVIAVALHSALGVDDTIENYHAQSLNFSYSAVNPPLYDWLLYGVQKVTGPKQLSFAILNYGALCVCLILLYRVARRAIVDPRLQALSIFSYSLVWEIGHESHRILTHSNLMVVAIAATVLTLLQLAERATLVRYLLFGFCIAFGLLAKLGFIAFLGALLIAALFVPRIRKVIVDWRFAATATVLALAIALFQWAASISVYSIPPSSPRMGMVLRIGALLRSFFGYVFPLLPIAVVIFFHPPTEREELTDERRVLRRFLIILISAGMGIAMVTPIVSGTLVLRPRYFHALLLLFPIVLFVFLDRYRWPARSLRIFLGVAAAVVFGIMIEQVLPRLAPSEWAFGSCRLGIPYDSLGRALEARFGKTPTLVGVDENRAGQLRAAVPGARTVALPPVRYRPPPRPTAPCVLVWIDEGAGPANVAQAIGVSLDAVKTLEIPWFQPLMRGQRISRFYVSVLPDSSEICR